MPKGIEVSHHLLATRMLNAAAAVVGPQPHEWRVELLAEHPAFAPCSQAELEELAWHI